MRTIQLSDANFAALVDLIGGRWAEVATKRNEAWLRRYTFSGDTQKETARRNDREFARLSKVLAALGVTLPEIDTSRFLESFTDTSGRQLQRFNMHRCREYRAEIAKALHG
jgi:hypothetical protein